MSVGNLLLWLRSPRVIFILNVVFWGWFYYYIMVVEHRPPQQFPYVIQIPGFFLILYLGYYLMEYGDGWNRKAGYFFSYVFLAVSFVGLIGILIDKR